MPPDGQDASLAMSDETKLTAKAKLQDAARQGNLQEVIQLVANQKPHFPGYLEAGLSRAFSWKHSEIAKFLLEQGAELTDIRTYFPALQNMSIPILELLVEFGWDVNSPVRESTALCLAAPDDTLVRWLLDKGADPNLGPDHELNVRESPSRESGYVLEKVAATSNVALYDHLLRHGANPEKSLSLHYAAESGDIEQLPMIARLLELGFDINASDEVLDRRAYGTPLDWALRYNTSDDSKMIEYLRAKGAISQRVKNSS